MLSKMANKIKYVDLLRLLVYNLCIPVSLISSVPTPDSSTSIFQDPDFQLNRTTNGDGYFYTSYQRSIECTASFPPLTPKTIHELQNIVLFALKNNHRVKAVGSLHSITDVICTDGILVEMKEINHFSFDPQTNYATSGAGAILLDFQDFLHEHGRGLTCHPTYGGITVGGAVGVGVHGTNLKQPATLSDQLVALTFIDGLGNIQRITESDEDFKAFRVHLGLLGIVYELVFKTTEQYKLEVQTFPVDDGILWPSHEIVKLAESNDFFQFFWFPTSKEVIMSIGNRVPVNASGNCQSYLIAEVPFINSNGVSMTLELMQKSADQVGYFFAQSYAKIGSFREIPGRTPLYTEVGSYTSCLPKSVGYSHKIMTNGCKQCTWDHGEFALIIEDAAVAIELDELPRAMNTLREIFDEFLVGFPLVGILFRFIKESDSYLGVSSNRRSLEIEWVSVPRFDRTHPKLGITAFQAIGQALIERHRGRPHWGKSGLYYTNPKILHRAYPQLPKFVDVMKRMDPHELFMNDFGRRIKYGSNSMTMSRAAQKRCALNEACLCQKHADCGGGGPADYVCGDFLEFKVCKKPTNQMGELREIVSRNVIELAADLGNNMDYVLGFLAPYKGFGVDVNKQSKKVE